MLAVTVDFHGLALVEHTAVGLHAVALRRGRFYFERDPLLGWIAYTQRDGDVVVERTLETQLVGRLQSEAAQRVYKHGTAADRLTLN